MDVDEKSDGAISGFGRSPLAEAVSASSSTGIEGSFPLVYDAVNSHERPALRHNAHGHLPVHRVFFLREGQWPILEGHKV